MKLSRSARLDDKRQNSQPAAPPEVAPASRIRLALVMLVLAAITIAVFWRVQDHGFVWDDGVNVERNQYLKPVTVPNIARFWRGPYENLYIPLTYTAWGAIAHFASRQSKDKAETELDPRLFHWANVLFHVLGSVVVLLIARRLVKNDWAAGAGAMLFALHPLQVEPVAWVTGLKDLLSGFLSLVALWQYLSYAGPKAVMAMSGEEGGSPTGAGNSGRLEQRYFNYGVATLAYMLALLAKPGAVVVPVMAWLFESCVLRRSAKRVAFSLIPWLALAVPFVVFAKEQQPDTLLDFVTPLWARFFVATDALAFYLYKIFVPIWLGPGYARSPEVILDEGWPFLTWLLPACLGAALWYKRRRFHWLVMAGGLFVAGLLPVLGVVQFQFQNWSTVADRYVYLSMLGPALGLSYVLSQEWRKRKWMVVGTGAVLLILVVKSASQVRIWHDSRTLWQHALDIGQDSAVVHTNLAVTMVDTNTDEAIRLLRQAVALAPAFPDARYNLGIALAHRGADAEAIEQYRFVLKLRPTYPEAHYFLAVALTRTGQLDEAIKNYQKAIEGNPVDAKAHNNLGNALADRGQLSEAIEHYLEAIKINPAYAGAYFNLGIALADRGELDEAARQYRNVLQLQPDHANAHNNLADVLARQGQRGAAIDHFREALRLRPDFPQAQRGLARLLGETGTGQK